jgi:hypothetical protein
VYFNHQVYRDLLITLYFTNLSLFHIVQTGSGAHLAFNSMGTGVIYCGVRRLGRDVDHSPPSSADAMNEWSFTSAPRTCLLEMGRRKFTFFYFSCYSNLTRHSSRALIYWVSDTKVLHEFVSCLCDTCTGHHIFLG